ncbi:L-selectin-like [Misgurnus anguillicaudatus]|uniref:L-selectin-like n=1 Tax=Misgurnus anguillicaudatus TaxID=75329 RepID=UPI003CCF11F0
MNGEWFDEDCSEPRSFFCSTPVRSMILVSEPKSWEEALDYCRGRYVDLVSLTSDKEQVAAVRKIQSVQNGYVWTGLRFLSGSWFWVYGDSLQYENWLDKGQKQCPGNLRCGALAVASGKWEPRSCEEKLNFLCFQK